MKKAFKVIVNIFFNILFIISALYLATEVYRYFNPYDYNYYYNLLVKKIDLTKITIENKNEYYKATDYEYVQNTDLLYPKNKQELLNALYSFINSGQKEVTFYCQKDYKNCTKDARELIYNKKKNVISVIYEFAHPYNDYKTISCGTDKNTGRVTFSVNKKYTNKKIKQINAEVDRVYNELYNPLASDIDNIKKFHDYLANTIEYDTVKSDYVTKKSKKDSKYDSSSAYGALIEKKAICGGYTDAMYLFLDKMGIKSIRITSESHIWNGVYLDGNWYHLDVTWDDAKYTNGKSFLTHKYFLIDTNQLLELDTKSHSFYQDVYLEFSNSN